MPYFSLRSIQLRTLVQKYIHSHFTRGSGANSPRPPPPPKPKKYVNKKWRLFLFTSNITQGVDSPVMMLIQIHARRVRGHAPQEMFFIKMVQSGAFWVFQNTLLSTLRSTILRIIFYSSKNYLPYQSPIYVSMKVNTIEFCKGGLGGFPPEAEKFLKKSNEM